MIRKQLVKAAAALSLVSLLTGYYAPIVYGADGTEGSRVIQAGTNTGNSGGPGMTAGSGGSGEAANTEAQESL